MNKMDLTVAVLQSMPCSGSVLISTLLDGHPQIALLPRTCDYILEHFNEAPKSTPLELIAFLMQKNVRWFYGETQPESEMYTKLGQEKNRSYYIPPEKLAEFFLENIIGKPITFTQTIISLHIAYHKAVQSTYFPHRKYEFPKLIFLNVHGSDCSTFEALDEKIVNKQMVFLVRDIPGSMASSIRYQTKCAASCGHFDPNVFVDCFKSVVETEDKIRAITNYKNLMVISLEVLHRRGQLVMGLFCDFTGIRYEESLLETTVMGLKWWYPGTSGKPGLDPELPINDLRKETSGIAKLLGSLVMRRMALRGIPLGRERLTSGLWNIFKISEIEKSSYRLVQEKLRETLDVTSLFTGKGLPKARGMSRFLGITTKAILQPLIFMLTISYVMPAYFERLKFSLNYYLKRKEERYAPSWINAESLSTRVNGMARADGTENLVFEKYCTLTERLYTDEELAILSLNPISVSQRAQNL